MNAKISSFFSKLKKIIYIAVFFSLLIWVFVLNFSFVFKYKVQGVVQAVQAVGAQSIIAQGNLPLNSQVFSVSVSIKDLETNQIHVASSEDRQWGAIQPGNCVVAAYFPYEPWRITKGTTGHNARFLKGYLSCDDLPKNENWFDRVRFFFLWY